MPGYELNILLKKMPRDILVNIVRKIGEDILKNKGIIRKIEYLGFKKLPEKIPDPINPKDHKLHVSEANFFLLHFDSSPLYTAELNDKKLKINRDILKFKFIKKENLLPYDYECTISEDFQSPALRKNVQKIIEEGKKLPSGNPPKHSIEDNYI